MENKNISEFQYDLKTPKISLDEGIVLPIETRVLFEEAIGAIRHHKTIYSDWGFGDVDPAGRNMVLNFYGPPGTGKTMAAEALAGSLKRKYIHIGISEIESKFVGETAKNISRAFNAASSEGALIFFDEADTLLGARLSSVTQGVDNEINAMRSSLLIELEKFDGIVVFATNFPKNYDSAFVSRIRYHIEFKLPDFECRKKLLERMLVPGIPLKEDREKIIHMFSEMSDGLSGREIRTVLRVAFPRAIVASPELPIVAWSHLEKSINEVRKSKSNIGRKNSLISNKETDIESSRKILGLSN